MSNIPASPCLLGVGLVCQFWGGWHGRNETRRLGDVQKRNRGHFHVAMEREDGRWAFWMKGWRLALSMLFEYVTHKIPEAIESI